MSKTRAPRGGATTPNVKNSTSLWFLLREGLSAAFYAVYGFTGAFGRKMCKFTFPQRRRNLRKSLLDHKTYGREKGPKMAALKITILLKIITRIKLLFSNYLGRYSYSFRARQELISVTVTVLWV